MENLETPAVVADPKAVRKSLIEGFKNFVLENGHLPPSIYKFTKELGIAETEYYSHYNSLDALDAEVWSELHENTVERLNQEEAYLTYTVREKWLAYYFTILEEWKKNRSYLLWSYKNSEHMLPQEKACLAGWKHVFNQFAEDRVTEGTDIGEIASRPYITSKYHKAYWLQANFLLEFWIKDRSKNFELTDAAVEKAVNLGMDLVSNNALDTAFDFVKFVWQNR